MKTVVNRLKSLLESKNIIDIIIFGSRAKNKSSPNDIDIAVLLNQKDEQIKNSIKKMLPEADVQVMTYSDIYSSLFLTVIKEGFSVRRNSYVHNLYNIAPVKLYKYDLKQLTASKKVMFERGIKFIKGITKLSNSVVLVPIDHSGNFEDFLRQWNLDIDTKEYELLPLMRKED